MAAQSSIEWTDATWNPIVGCTIVSPGCTNCYAMQMAARINKMTLSYHYEGLTEKAANGKQVWTGKIARAPDRILTAPLRWKKQRRIFVNSMGDLFHESIPDEWIDRAFAVMALCPQHTFQVLTKRADRMCKYFEQRDRLKQVEIDAEHIKPSVGEPWAPKHWRSFAWPLPNAWLGISAERQQEWDERKEHLRGTPAAVRFASFEPLLGSIVEPRPMSDYLQWAIVGGESGRNARQMHPNWARSLRDQCAAANVPYFFKQWGEWAPHTVVAGGDLGGDVRAGRVEIVHPSGRKCHEILTETGGRQTEKGSRYMARVGKKAAGRHLDGVEHSAFPSLSSL